MRIADWLVDVLSDDLTVIHGESIAHTGIGIERTTCSGCGAEVEERHILELRDKRGGRIEIGSLAACPNCQPTHWLFYTHGTATEAARIREAKTVP